MIERDLHEGVQQHLVALAVNLQLAGRLVDADPAAAKALLDEMARDVQQALDETAQLAQRIYPPLLEAGGLAAALRAAAASAGVRASVEVAAGASYPPEVAARGLLVLSRGARARRRRGTGDRDRARRGRSASPSRSSRTVPDSAAGLERLRDRVEALGGRLTIRSEPGGGTRVSGSLPLSG